LGANPKNTPKPSPRAAAGKISRIMTSVGKITRIKEIAHSLIAQKSFVRNFNKPLSKFLKITLKLKVITPFRLFTYFLPFLPPAFLPPLLFFLLVNLTNLFFAPGNSSPASTSLFLRSINLSLALAIRAFMVSLRYNFCYFFPVPSLTCLAPPCSSTTCRISFKKLRSSTRSSLINFCFLAFRFFLSVPVTLCFFRFQKKLPVSRECILFHTF
jgi:hypothetical protein